MAPLLLAVLALGVAWSLVTPAWQAPDENSHFAYVQSLAENGSLPGRDATRLTFSTEQQVAATASNADLAAAQPSIKMEWNADAFDKWRRADHMRPGSGRADGGGPNPAASNPPLYYLFQVPAYRVAYTADVFGRLEAMRIWSLLWLVVAVAATWLLAGEFSSLRPATRVLAAGVVGLAPMMLFISSSVSPDSMLYATWAIVLWLGVRLIRRPVNSRGVALFAGAVGVACVVKATSYALLPAAVMVIGLAAWRSTADGRTRQLATLGAAAGAIGLTLGVWVVVARLIDRAAAPQVSVVTSGGAVSVREFLSYLWQFYLPKTGLQTDFASLAPTLPAWDFLVKGVVASFGWTEVGFDAWVYWVAVVVGFATCVGVALRLWRERDQIDLPVVVFFSLVVLALLIGLHVSEYRQLNGGALNFFQGRYLLPLAPLGGLAMAYGVSSLPVRSHAGTVGALLALLLIFNLFSLGLMMTRFYA